jgi:hypothetical protein
LVVCFDKIYIALFEGSGSVQICGGGLGEKMQCSSAQVSSSYCKHNFKYYRKTQYFEDFRPKKFREIQVIKKTN